MDHIEVALRDLEEDLSRAVHMLKLIKRLREFGASSVPSDQPESEPPWPEAIELWEDSRQRRTDLPILAGSIVLYLAGRFEQFARTVIENAAEEMASQCDKFSQLPTKLQEKLIQQTVAVVQKPERFGYDRAEANVLLTTLADGLRTSSGLSGINSDCLSLTESNLRPDVMKDLAKRIGVDNFWLEVSKQTGPKLFFETKNENYARQQVESRLNGLMEERNRIAHPTPDTSFPDPDQVLEHARFLRMLGGVTVEIVRVHIAVFASERR